MTIYSFNGLAENGSVCKIDLTISQWGNLYNLALAGGWHPLGAVVSHVAAVPDQSDGNVEVYDLEARSLEAAQLGMFHVPDMLNGDEVFASYFYPEPDRWIFPGEPIYVHRIIEEDASDMGIALTNTLVLLPDDESGEAELFRSFTKMACRGPFIIF